MHARASQPLDTEQGVPSYMQLQEEGVYPFPAPAWTAGGKGWSALAVTVPVSACARTACGV